MRRIGKVDSQLKADAFAAAMRKREITVQVDVLGEQWEIWAADEDRVGEVRSELPKFLDANTSEAQLREHVREAPAPKPDAKEAAPDARKSGSGRWGIFRLPKGGSWFKVAPVTVGLMVLSLLVGIGSEFGANKGLVSWLVMGPSGTYRDVLASGEVWRLLTPIFVHFGILHLALNMWWLRDLGVMVERALGKLKLVLLVVVIAVVSNFAENLLAAPGGIAGGMSGVVFGLMAYAWIRGRLDLTSGIYVPNQVMIFMGMFFAMCWMGLFENIANITHTAGLLVGLGWGYFDASRVVRS
jgi:GlpG protein